jgi:hypothetical protein
MSTDSPAITLAGRDVTGHRHACAFFNSLDEEFEVLLPFVRDGLARGDKAFHIVDPDGRDAYLRRMKEGGVDVDRTLSDGQFQVKVWEDAYLKPGYFDQAAMLELIQDVLETGKKEGYPLTRLVAHMEWCLRDCHGVEDIVEYESRLNYVLPQYDDIVICTYDVAKHSAETIMGVLRTHPVVIIGGILQTNPFYVAPDEFLAELRARKERQASA